MNIRRYQNRDFNDLACLYKAFFNEMREWQGWGQLKLDEKEAVETAKESLEENSWVFVAEDSGKLVGFARVQLWDGAYFVREVFVAKSFRRKGVGSKLLAKCEDFVRRRGETSIYLSVEPKHSASLNFLIHNGYDTLNMLELRKDFVQTDFLERQGEVEILGHKLRLLKRKI
ncbi:MAG: GNAT family N-acetyltransferase [Candidatus Bathyarchaeia archaeon]